MYLPSIQPVNSTDVYIIGNVTIDPSAVLGPGTILQAAPNSNIFVGSGACLGMGTIINAYQGDIEIESGAILGAGVLMIGNGKIGGKACIGAASTIYNASIDPMTIIPPGSLIGDSSRRVEALSSEEFVECEPLLEETQSVSPVTETPLPETPEIFTDADTQSPQLEVEAKPEASNHTNKKDSSPIIGQIYVNQLLVTLFPETRRKDES